MVFSFSKNVENCTLSWWIQNKNCDISSRKMIAHNETINLHTNRESTQSSIYRISPINMDKHYIYIYIYIYILTNMQYKKCNKLHLFEQNYFTIYGTF